MGVSSRVNGSELLIDESTESYSKSDSIESDKKTPRVEPPP